MIRSRSWTGIWTKEVHKWLTWKWCFKRWLTSKNWNCRMSRIMNLMNIWTASSRSAAVPIRRDRYPRNRWSRSLRRSSSSPSTWKSSSGKSEAATTKLITITSACFWTPERVATQAELARTSLRIRDRLLSCGFPTLSTIWTKSNSNDQPSAMHRNKN